MYKLSWFLCASLIILTNAQSSYASELQSIAKDFAIGAVSGTAAMTVYTPFHYFQNRKIQKLPIFKNPLYWFRGWLTLSLGTAPKLATQIAIYQAVIRAMQRHSAENISYNQKIIAAILAGGVSGSVSNVTHLIALHQENNGTSFLQTIKRLFKSKSLARGLGSTVIREMLFTNIYMVFLHDLEEKIYKKTQNSIFSQVASDLISGSLVAAITQPFMVITAKLYADEKKFLYKNDIDAACQIFKQGGLPGFYNGTAYRTPGIILALLAMSKVDKELRNK